MTSNGGVSNGACGNGKVAQQLGEKRKEPLVNGLKKKIPSASFLPDLLPTQEYHEVPLLFHEPHVQTGYRPIHQPLWYYLYSMLQLHNESMNVWTHLIAAALLARKLWYYSYHIDFLGDPYAYPFLAGLFSAILLYSCSSGAHCMQSKSELCHYTSFMFDYAGIGFYGLGSTIVHYWYCCEENFHDFVQWFFIPLSCVLAVTICVCSSVAKIQYSRPYPPQRKVWMIIPVALIYINLVSPILHRLNACFTYNTDCNESIPYHITQIFWFVLSGAFFALEMPQKYMPGKCDYFFHGHQLFHVCIMLCSLYQMEGVLLDFEIRSEVFRARPEPTFWSAFGPLLIVVCIELVIIWCLHLFVKRRLAARDAATKQK